MGFELNLDKQKMKREISDKEQQIQTIDLKKGELKIMKRCIGVLKGFTTVCTTCNFAIVINSWCLGNSGFDEVSPFALGMWIFNSVMATKVDDLCDEKIEKKQQEAMRLMSEIELRKTLIKTMNCNQ